MAHQAGQAMERGGTGNLSPNLSPLPWPIGEKSIGATGLEKAVNNKDADLGPVTANWNRNKLLPP